MAERQPYDPTKLEANCRERWRQDRAFVPSPETSGTTNSFVYSCTPFTTGNAHMGHVRSYTIADACARRARSQGDSVLWAMGFDAFGLPNEIAAIEHSIAPRDWVDACKRRMIEQFDRLGLSVDWSRCFDTSEPEYYRWTQWVFLRFLERDLVYRAEGIENWCDSCQCVLAALQVSDEGLCWRCRNPVTLACVPQWYFRILPYAAELERGLDSLSGWDDTVLACQRALFGKTSGAELVLELPSGQPLSVFLAYPQALSKAAFIALSPNHSYVEQLVSKSQIAANLGAQRLRSLDRGERSLQRVQVVDSGLKLQVPGLIHHLPLIITPAVDMRFGGGAVLGVPALDATDAAIAEHLGLAAWSSEAEDHQADLTPACRYRLRDNSISRQRSWGAPIPIIHCEVCGQVPVPDADLPVRLPDTLIPTGEGNALARHPTFAHCNCPRCGGRARRDTDTLDVHFDSIWMLVPFCVPPQARVKSMFTHPELRRWLPVAQVVCGADQAGWWMNDRLFFRVMRDCGYFKDLKDSEPVRKLLMHEMVLSDGRKMSKSLGNAVDPDDLVHRFGADAVRLSVLKVNPRKSFNWTEEALRENYQFLSDLWNFTHEFVVARTSAADDNVACDPSLRKLARCSAAAQRKGSAAFESRSFHLVQKELKLLFDAIRRTWIEIERAHIPGIAEAIAVQDAISIVLDLLEPLAPHISSELNTKLNRRVIPASTTSAAIHRGPGKEAIGDKVSNISLTRTSIGHQ